MVSKRRFFIIFLMMLVMLFIFQFSQVAKDELSVDNNDKYLSKELPDASSQWSGTSQWAEESGRRVLFIGDENSKIGKNAALWCNYIKAEFECMNYLPEASEENSVMMVIIDAASLDTECYLDTIEAYTGRGNTVVFGSLPECSVLENNEQLRNILGITKIPESSVTVDGIRVFDGVFVGGEAVYLADEPEEEKYQDMNLTMPWYITAEGSKSYIVGLMDEDLYEREQFPRIVWRYTGNYTMVFAVNGDYLATDSAFGILDLFLYESNDVALYPVVNAQSTVFLDTIVLTDETEQNMYDNYSRNLTTATKDIFMPGLISLIKNEKIVPSFMLMSKYDFASESTAETEELSTYINQINEVSGEAGYSYRYINGTLADKIAYDDSVYASSGITYNFRTAYLEKLTETSELSSNVVSVVCSDTMDEPFGYYSDNLMVQNATADATDYSYTKDFMLRSMNSSLGYMSTMVDFHNTYWSGETQYRWENYFDEIYSNFSTYWSNFAIFEQTTLSDSDSRIRRFLALDYKYEYADDCITLNVSEGNGDSYFLLRTHDKDVDSVTNAEYSVIDDGAILIHAKGATVTVRLKDSDDVLKYNDSIFK